MSELPPIPECETRGSMNRYKELADEIGVRYFKIKELIDSNGVFAKNEAEMQRFCLWGAFVSLCGAGGIYPDGFWKEIKEREKSKLF